MKFALKQFAVILITAVCSIAVAVAHACIVWPEMIAKTRGLDRDVTELVRMPMFFETCIVFFTTGYRLAQTLALRIGDFRSAGLLRAQSSAHLHLLHAVGGVLIIGCRSFLHSFYGAPLWQNVLMISYGFALIVMSVLKPSLHSTAMRSPRATKMWVVTVDGNGKEKDGHWVDIPEPDSFASRGFMHIERYVSRLLQSSARFTSLLIATPDQRTALSIWRRGGVPEFSLAVEWRSEPERERAVRKFFSVHGLSISQDYLAGNGGVPDATRCLTYFLPPDAPLITKLTKDVLGQIYHVQEQDALNFSIKEYNEEQNAASSRT